MKNVQRSHEVPVLNAQPKPDNVFRRGAERMREKAHTVIAAGTLATVALAASGCALHETPPIKGNKVVIIGDSLINRMAPYIRQQLIAKGWNPLYIGGMEGHWEMGGGNYPTAQNMLEDPKYRAFQKLVGEADLVDVAYGTNDIRNGISPQQLGQEDLIINKDLSKLAPHARRYMSTLATAAPQLMAPFTLANKFRLKAATNSRYGFDTVPMEQIWCNGDPSNINVPCPTLAVDSSGLGLHPGVEGLKKGADGIVSTIANARRPSLTYVLPQ